MELTVQAAAVRLAALLGGLAHVQSGFPWSPH